MTPLENTQVMFIDTSSIPTHTDSDPDDSATLTVTQSGSMGGSNSAVSCW